MTKPIPVPIGTQTMKISPITLDAANFQQVKQHIMHHLNPPDDWTYQTGQSTYLWFTNNQRLSLYADVVSLNSEVDFLSEAFQRRVHPKAAKPLLVKAIEGRFNKPLTILDATVGLGQDAMTLCYRGHQVTGIEQNPYVYLLLKDGCYRFSQHTTNPLLLDSIIWADSLSWLSEQPNDYDVIYLDPMFPERKKSAKVKKNMQLLQQLLGHQTNIETLLAQALQRAKKKVVLKRPIDAPILSIPGYQPIHYRGKTNRFDVYPTHF